MPKAEIMNVFWVVSAMEAAVIIFGNALTIFVFSTQISHLKLSYFLLINLAVADLLVGITEPIVLATEKIPRSKVGPGEGQGTKNPSSDVQVFASLTSLFFLALISLERAYAVLCPLRHHVVNPRLYIYSTVFLWAVGLCFLVFKVLAMQMNIELLFFSQLACRIVCLLIMFASYLKIRKRLRRRAPGLEVHNGRSTERNLKLSRTFYIVVALSLVLWLPSFVVYTTQKFCIRCIPVYAMAVVNILHVAYSMVNPFVYAFRMPIFKAALRKRWWKRQNIELRLVQTTLQILGKRGSYTLNTDTAVSIRDIALISHRRTNGGSQNQAVDTMFTT